MEKVAENEKQPEITGVYLKVSKSINRLEKQQKLFNEIIISLFDGKEYEVDHWVKETYRNYTKHPVVIENNRTTAIMEWKYKDKKCK